MLDRAFQTAVARPWVTVLVFVLLAAGLGYGLKDMKFELSIYDSVDPNFESTTLLQKMKQDFEDGNTITLFFSHGAGGTPLSGRELCAIREWTDSEWRANPEIIGVYSPFDLRKSTKE